jgi:putative transposase/transposase-like zinc-binding protein
MASSALEVAHIFRRFGPAYRQKHPLPRHHLRAMRAIESCRTAALGGHLYECDRCGAPQIVYNSCRNRHCPKCQTLEQERWLERRREELLPVPYFHVVFTLPAALNDLVWRNQRRLYDLLFACASETLLEIAADPQHLGARIGFLALLHTWSQQMTEHPHLHCIVPGGGLSVDRRRWLGSRPDFFLPVRVLSARFRRKFLGQLRALHAAGQLQFPGKIRDLESPKAFRELLDGLGAKDWVVYCKPPFGGPRQVLEYLSRYTHRVAISNERLVRLEGEQVVFRYRDRAHGDCLREMTLPVEEFLRRFLLHILPERFVRIRSYGLLATRNRGRDLALCRQLLGVAKPAEESRREAERESWSELLKRLTGRDPALCPECRQGRLLLCREVAAEGLVPRAPP